MMHRLTSPCTVNTCLILGDHGIMSGKMHTLEERNLFPFPFVMAELAVPRVIACSLDITIKCRASGKLDPRLLSIPFQ